ncbi:MAG: hypothetical protein CMD20_05890 [Flavobacteriales bacterium]|nr:hypothetical protein [Flavobacteriales bacterium]
MSLNHLKSWPINQKIIVSMVTLVFSILVFGGIAGLFIQEEINFIEDSSVGSRVTQLAQDQLDKKVNDIDFFKEIQQLIQETDSSILNKAFYVQIAYNLVVFMGLSLVLLKLFQVNELKSLTFKNKSVLLFLVAFVLAMNVPQVGSDATYINEMIGLDALQESLLGIDTLSDKESLISQYILLLPNVDRGWIITLIGLALIPAIGEELMFRGYLMNLFSQKSNYHNGIALSALVFAFVHFNFSNFFYYFVLGVVMGYVYYWGRNLLFPIIIHFINNALVVFGYLYAISNEVSEELNYSYTLMPYITLGLSLLIFYLNNKRNKHIIQ